MNYYLVVFALILLMSHSICCFDSDNLCQKDTKKIKICVAHNCGANYCSIDKLSCKNFILMGILMKKNTSEAKVFKKFMKNIRKCDFEDYRNVWAHRFHFG
jgi:hypothetical protein